GCRKPPFHHRTGTGLSHWSKEGRAAERRSATAPEAAGGKWGDTTAWSTASDRKGRQAPKRLRRLPRRPAPSDQAMRRRRAIALVLYHHRSRHRTARAVFPPERRFRVAQMSLGSQHPDRQE